MVYSPRIISMLGLLAFGAGMAVVIPVYAKSGGSMSHMGNMSHGTSRRSSDLKATGDLSKLVQANLKEAAVLKAELPSLRGNSAAVSVWRHMIQDHTNGANMLAGLSRSMGGRPNTSTPSASPMSGSPSAIIQATLAAHQATLQTVKGMENGASAKELTILHKVEGVVGGHIGMLRSLARSSSSMGGGRMHGGNMGNMSHGGRMHH